MVDGSGRQSRPWAAGSASGVGSLPGRDIREAVRTVLGELPALPHLPELPGRGAGSDMVGRTLPLLVDLHADLQPAGWRLTDRPGRDVRRAAATLAGDLDTLEELTQGYTGPLKAQVTGCWTLAATVERPRGGPVLGDAGACRDLADSLREGVAAHVAALRHRVPGADLVLQLDEPALPGVLAGRVPTASGFDVVGAVEPVLAAERLRGLVEAARSAGAAAVLVHCCAARPPLEVIQRAGADAASVDFDLLTEAEDEPVGTMIEAGLELFAGVVPARDAPLSAAAGSVAGVRSLWRRLGFAPETLAHRVVITPTCGLAGASPAYARTAMAHARAAARELVDSPEG
jgi:methionine synthase II (cobalamin-independent)